MFMAVFICCYRRANKIICRLSFLLEVGRYYLCRWLCALPQRGCRLRIYILSVYNIALQIRQCSVLYVRTQCRPRRQPNPVRRLPWVFDSRMYDVCRDSIVVRGRNRSIPPWVQCSMTTHHRELWCRETVAPAH